MSYELGIWVANVSFFCLMQGYVKENKKLKKWKNSHSILYADLIYLHQIVCQFISLCFSWIAPGSV